MHKTITFIFCLLIFHSYSQAQSPISIKYTTYDKERDELLTGLMEILDVHYMFLQIEGDLSGKQFSLVEHTIKDKQQTSTPIHVNFSTKDRVITGMIMAVRQSEDSVKITFNFKGHFNFAKTYPIKNNHSHILMETFLENTPQNHIPFFAFTSGIAKEMEYQGKKGNWIDYCGLRDAKISPEEWGVKYSLPDYLYFTLTVE